MFKLGMFLLILDNLIPCHYSRLYLVPTPYTVNRPMISVATYKSSNIQSIWTLYTGSLDNQFGFKKQSGCAQAICVFIARQHTDARYWYSKYVCQSVCYVPLPYENGLTYRYSFFSPYGSPIILVLPASNIFTEFRRGHPLRGRKYRWGIKISQFSTNKSLYVANNTKYRHTMEGEWELVCDLSNGDISNDLERTPTLFSRSHHSNAKHLTNGYRYGHSYYRRQIGNRTQAFEWHQFQWHWATSMPDFKVTILFNVK